MCGEKDCRQRNKNTESTVAQGGTGLLHVEVVEMDPSRLTSVHSQLVDRIPVFWIFCGYSQNGSGSGNAVSYMAKASGCMVLEFWLRREELESEPSGMMRCPTIQSDTQALSKKIILIWKTTSSTTNQYIRIPWNSFWTFQYMSQYCG